MKRPIIELVGSAHYVPARVVTNHDLEKMLDTSDEWIRERTGIVERRLAAPGETLTAMSKCAATRLLQETGTKAEDLDTIVVATASWDRLLPSAACDIQAAIGAVNAAAFDVGAACAGYLYALQVAEGLVAADQARNILLIGGERLSSITNWTDRATAILFGDGVGCTLVRPAKGQRGVLAVYKKSDGRLAELLYRPGGFPPTPEEIACHAYAIKMAGREVFKHAVLSMADACDHALQQAGLAAEQIDLLIAHQANIRIIEATAKHAGMPMDKVYVNVDRFGNTSAASIPIAFDEAVRTGRIQPGMTVMLVAFGGGFTWASAVVKW